MIFMFQRVVQISLCITLTRYHGPLIVCKKDFLEKRNRLGTIKVKYNKCDMCFDSVDA